jgi:hypothetical protein
LIGDFGDCRSNAAIDFLGGLEEGQLRRNPADLARWPEGMMRFWDELMPLLAQAGRRQRPK